MDAGRICAGIHKTLRVTPAMAAALSQTVMDWSDIIALMDAEAPKPGPRGSYKKKDSNVEGQSTEF